MATKYSIDQQKLALDLSLTRSSIVVEDSEDEYVSLEFLGLRKRTAEEIFSISFCNNRLHVKEKENTHPPAFLSLLNASAEGDMVLRVPPGTAVSGKIATVKGDIKADQLKFHGEIRTLTGKISVREIISDGLEINTVGGSVFLGSLQGFLSGKSVTGRFTIDRGIFKEINLNTVSGDVRLKGNFELASDGAISTMSGDIHLDITSFSAGKQLTLSTLSGSSSTMGEYPEGAVVIKPRMPFIKNHPFRQFVPSMKEMFSSYFSHSQKHGDEVEVEAESLSEAQTQQDKESRKMILQMLSEGKISVEEAERLIKALGDKG